MALRYWIFLVCTLLLTSFIGYSTFRTAQLLRKWQPDRNLLLMPAETILRLLLIVACIGLGTLSGLSVGQLGWVWPSTAWRQIGVGMAWGVSLALFFFASTKWIVAKTGRRFYSTSVLETVAPKSGWELLGVALALIPVVVLEELIFRSLLIGGLAPLMPAMVLILGTGIVFGLLHSPQGLWGMLGAGLAGGLLGWMFLASGSLLMPVASHYVANFCQLALALWTGTDNLAHGQTNMRAD